MNAPDDATHRRPGSILFVCGMNAIRSPMAEAIAHSLMPDVYVASAGVKCGDRDPFVDVILSENGLKLGEFVPRSLDELGDGYFDLIVTMSPEAHHVALDRASADAVAIEFWPMPDPSVVSGSRQQIIDAYRDVYRRIEDKLKAFRNEAPQKD